VSDSESLSDSESFSGSESSPGFVAEDTKVKWSKSTDVDIFKTVYVNDKGEITVESSDGDKVIAPGTGSDYSFSLKNNGNISLDYTMTLDSVFQLSDVELPLEVRLRKGDSEYVIGSENTWVKPEKLSEVYETGTLDVNHYEEYTLEWQWPFTAEDETQQENADAIDTFLGNEAVTQDVNFTLSIITQAEETPGAVPVDQDEIEANARLDGEEIKSNVDSSKNNTSTRESTGTKSTAKTGDNTPIQLYLVMTVISGAALIILIVTTRRRRNRS
jgi:hypothetical protein